MSRFIVTSDVHIHPFRIGSRNGGKDRLQDGLNALRQTFQAAEKYEAQWLGLGDFKQPKTNWPVDAQNGIIALLEEFGDAKPLMLLGNHDWISDHGSGLSAFKKYARVVDEPCVLPGVLVLPHGVSPEVRADYLKGAVTHKVAMVIGHAFLHEAAVGPTDIRLAAIPPEEFGLGKNWSIPLGLFGDVHKAQWYRPDARQKHSWEPITKRKVRLPAPFEGEAFYPGSPYQQSWGEVNEWPKGCLLVDVATGSVEQIPISSPRFWSLNFLTESEFSPWAEDKSQVGGFEDHFVKFIVGPWAASKRSWFEEWREREKPRTFQVIPQRVQEVKERAPVHAGLSSDELLKGYLSWKPPQITGASKKVIFEAGRRLMNG